MFILDLEMRGCELCCRLKIRQYQPGAEETTLYAGLKVDYDLFVNKLAEDVREFAGSLKKPSG
jgi:hypothetical protein